MFVRSSPQSMQFHSGSIEQVDNIALVKMKWEAIMAHITIPEATPANATLANATPADATPADATPADATLADAEEDKKLQEVIAKYLRRLREGEAAYPAIFAEEESFWAGHPADVMYAPFPPEFVTGKFNNPPVPYDGPPKKPSATADWLLRCLDAVHAIPAPGACISQQLNDKLSALWADELKATRPGGCKHGRDDNVLTLYSSGGKKPESRVQYNPKTDVAQGECALIRMKDAKQTPGQRGWELALVNSDPKNAQGNERLQVSQAAAAESGAGGWSAGAAAYVACAPGIVNHG